MLEHRGAILNLYDTTMTYNGEKIELTKNEFRILQTLMENKGRVVSRDTLMTKLWETDNYIEEKALSRRKSAVDISSRRSKNVFTIFEKNPICASVEFAVCGNLFSDFCVGRD